MTNTTPHLADLDLSGIRQNWRQPQRNASVTGAPLRVGGKAYEKGIGMSGESSWRLALDGKGVEFRAFVGMQDDCGGRAEFILWGDDKIIYRSAPVMVREIAKEIRVDLTGVQVLELMVDPVIDRSLEPENWMDPHLKYANLPPGQLEWEDIGGLEKNQANWIDPVIVHNGAPLTACPPVQHPRWPNLKDVIVCWKSHLDIGFTHPLPELLEYYRNGMVDTALTEIAKTDALPPDQHFRWTLPAWLVDWVYSGQPDAGRKARLEQALKAKRLQWHALPFTFQAEGSDLEELVRGLGFSSRISRQLGMPMATDGKLTDVPSQAWGLPVVLAHAGIKFLHIGVNPLSPNPHVPVLFWWEGPDGSRVLTGYNFHGYGWWLPPHFWEYKTWLVYIVQGENLPPPSVEKIKDVFARLQKALPQARIRFGQTSEFADAILGEGKELPVVRADMPDTWTHGQMSKPEPTRVHRHAATALISLGILDTELKAWGIQTGNVAPLLAEGYDEATLHTEHTWGTDSPVFGQPDHATWEKKLAEGAYDKALTSFTYHSAHAHKAAAIAAQGILPRLKALAEAVSVEGPRHVVFNPLPWERSGMVEVEGREVFVEGVPAGGYKTVDATPSSRQPQESGEGAASTKNLLETPFYRATFDLQRGGIASLIEKKTGRELVDQSALHVLGQYLHERFSAADVDAYLKSYCHFQFSWAGTSNCGFGKPKLDPTVPYWSVTPSAWKLSAKQETAGVCVTLTTEKTAGLAGRIALSFFFPNGQPGVDITWTVEKKTPELIPEGGWLCLPFAVKDPAFRVSHTGAPFSPEKDLVAGVNRRLLSVDHGISVRTGATGEGVGVASDDLPLWSLGEPGLWKFSYDYVPTKPELFVNLYNNMWDTNYPLWIDGSWSAHLRLWPIAAGTTEEAALFTPAWELRQPLLAASATGSAGQLPAAQAGLTLSRKGVRVTAFCPNPDGEGTVLRVWEQVGQGGELTVTLPPGASFTTATPVNLRGETMGASRGLNQSAFTFNLKAYAPASFVLE